MAKINHEFDLYEDVFIPPSGYRTEYMEFATYSLSMGFLTIIPALIYAGEVYGTEVGSKVFQMIRDDAFGKSDYYNRFHVFYDKNAKPIPWSEFDVLKSRYLTFANYLLTKRCTPCSPLTREGGLFHPKFILVQFANVQNEKRYRLIILSRNLTFAHYYETGIVLESTAEPVYDNGVGEKISGFIKSYWEATHKSSYRGINLDILSKTKFVLKTKTETEKPVEINLLFASQLQKSALCLKQEINESVSAGGYDSCNVISMNPTEGIIGTNGMDVSYVCNFSDMYEDGAKLKGKNVNANYWYNKYPDKKYSFVIEKSKMKQKKIPVHLHSKMYIFWDSEEKCKWTGLVYAGSANCSVNALQGRNEEVLLKMKFAGAQEDASLPTKSTNGGASDFDRNHTYCSVEKVKKDEIEVCEFDEEEFPVLHYVIDKEKVRLTDLGSEKIEITFEVKNNEDVPINVGFAKRNRTKDVTVASGELKKITIKVTQKSFSDLIVLRKQNENRLYLDSLNLDWQGRKIDEILGDLPIFIPNDLSGFIPPVHGITNAQDNVYEKLAQHRLYCTDFNAVLKKSSSAIREIFDRDIKIEEELGKLKNWDEISPDDEEIYEDYEDMWQEKHRIDELKAKGLEALKKTIEML